MKPEDVIRAGQLLHELAEQARRAVGAESQPEANNLLWDISYKEDATAYAEATEALRAIVLRRRAERVNQIRAQLLELGIPTQNEDIRRQAEREYAERQERIRSMHPGHAQKADA